MNANMMDIDPLSSYGQYNTYQPFHPPTSIPSTQPSVSHTQPNNTHIQPNIPHAQPNIPHTQPSVSHIQPTIPHTQPNIPHTQTNIPHTQPNDPHTQPIPYPYNKDYYPHLLFNQINDQASSQTDSQKLVGHTVAAEPDTTMPVQTNNNTEDEDIKPDITKIRLKRVRKLKGKTSSYWNKKINDKDFKFYGCSVCNISFQELTELDAHVTIHSNRITSYDIRIQNQKKRKRLKKEKKRKKKDAKVKTELDVEIKPEDGYIGTEKVGELNQVNDVKEKSKGKKKENGKNEVYKCFACNKQFALSYYLKIHVRSHTDEKPYVCNYCGQTFITASKLGRHNKRIHLAIRHQCRICFKFFNRFELLTKHFDKKHLDQKLDGEPYDYNAILPYLTELEDQFKLELEAKKPKTEDPWEWPHGAPKEPLETPLRPHEAPRLSEAQRDDTNVPKLEDTKVEKVEKSEILQAKFEFAEDIKEKIEEVEVKCEMVELEPEVPEALPDAEVFNESFEPQDESSDESVKEERLPSSDDEEYFPPDGWARCPPPESPPLPPSPPAKRKGGVGSCERCNRSFSSNSYLKIHMRTHTGEKPYACYVCGRGFITASKMHRHVLTHNETWLGEDGIKPEGAEIKSEAEDDAGTEKKIKKSKSKIEKAKTRLLKKPKKKMDPSVKLGRGRPNCCEYCGKKFLHVETLQVHKKSHEGEELIYKCNFCLEPQLDQESKREHEATHTGAKPYYCTLCGRNYKDRGAMIYHRKNHKPSDEKLFICDICSKRFNSQAKLARHIVTHSTEKFVLRYECPVCANMFHTRWHMQMHLKSHQKEGLILEENRNAVLAMVLQNARKIPKCDPHGTTLPAPPATPALHPPDERSRICNICGQVFQHFYYLEEHLKTHGNKIAVEDLDKEEEKKYTCQVCSKSFKLHYYLKLHSFTHTKEKPFICQQCGKGFITKGKLKRHLETHQGLKKYQCHICYKFFTRPSYLRIHVRTIHGTQDYNFRDYGVGVPLGLGGVPLSHINNM